MEILEIRYRPNRRPPYMAHVKGEPKVWEAGTSKEDAIQKFLVTTSKPRSHYQIVDISTQDTTKKANTFSNEIASIINRLF